MNILGISAGFHDAAATVLSRQGDIVFAGHSERYSKKKHDGKRRNMGTFPTLTAAKEHEQDINYFKHQA